MEFLFGFILGGLVGAAFMPFIWPKLVAALNKPKGP